MLAATSSAEPFLGGSSFLGLAGFGVGAGVGGSWGENDIYGAELDIKFITVGVYIKGDDAEMAYQDGVNWCVGAGNDVANWGEQAWSDSTQFFKGAADGFVGVMDSAINDISVTLDKTAEGIQLITSTTNDTLVSGAKTVANVSEEVWDDVATGTTDVVNTVSDGLNDAGQSAGKFIVKTWKSIF